MDEKERMEIFKKAKAIIFGHFVYASGRHGGVYVNKDAIYIDPEWIKLLCEDIAKHFQGKEIDVVAGPAVGGVILTQWVSYALSQLTVGDNRILAVYAEDGPNETKIFKRGYDKLIPGKKVLIVEDITTTGDSVKKVIDLVKYFNGTVVGVGLLCNRGGVNAEYLGVEEMFSLISLDLESYEEEDCLLCKDNVPINTELGKGAEYLARKKI
jgi:orotate phosphoribosyltransferase